MTASPADPAADSAAGSPAGMVLTEETRRAVRLRAALDALPAYKAGRVPGERVVPSTVETQRRRVAQRPLHHAEFRRQFLQAATHDGNSIRTEHPPGGRPMEARKVNTGIMNAVYRPGRQRSPSQAWSRPGKAFTWVFRYQAAR